MCDHIWQHPNYSQWWYVLIWWYEDIGYLPFRVKNMWYFILYAFLKLPSLFIAWLFWTFHTKANNMKALIILSHSWSPFLSLTCLYGKWGFVGLCVAFCGIFLRKKPSQLTHSNHMTMTISGQILSSPDYRKTKENVNITLLDLCLFTFYSVHANESTWHWL